MVDDHELIEKLIRDEGMEQMQDEIHVSEVNCKGT